MTLKTLHLVLLNLSLMLLKHFWKFDRSFCRADASDMELMVLKILVSSANVAILELVTELERLLSYRTNNNGARMDPCCMPDVPGSSLHVASQTVVFDID